jgi:hypothetical protein
MKKVNCWQIGLMAILIAPAIMISSAWAKKEPPKIETAIVAQIDAVTYSIDISGNNFLCKKGGELEVWMGGYEVLTYTSISDQQLNFESPEELAEPGTYLLTLLNACGKDDYEVTVGAVGPQGDQGAQGAGWDVSKIYQQQDFTGSSAVGCNAPVDKAVGGGGACPGATYIIASYPFLFNGGGQGWRVQCQDMSGGPIVNAGLQWVICVSP